ncbi:YfhE family protein [Ornithinibacillus xuwenensis]|jgi:YfhE-like protein|uniref:YfhE family protein n=1 Tax=Ornithinibacillus xuwenensis TaxID=3144668 RepID=A0ABU9XJ09_9BACI
MAKPRQESRDKFLSKTQEVLYQKEFKRADRASRQKGDRS